VAQKKPALQAGKDLAKPLVGQKISKNHPDSPEHKANWEISENIFC